MDAVRPICEYDVVTPLTVMMQPRSSLSRLDLLLSSEVRARIKGSYHWEGGGPKISYQNPLPSRITIIPF